MTVYIAVTRIAAPKEAIDRMVEGFRHAAPSMKSFPGCLGLELWRDGDTLQAISRWESREAVEAYAKSDLFGRHHAGGAGGTGGGQVEYYDAEVIF